MTSPTAPPAGWYADPHVPGTLRWFDGTTWTQHTAPAPAVQASPGVGAKPSDPMHWVIPTGRPWQCIVASYLGLLSIFIWILGPFAIGLGIWGIVTATRTNRHGRGRAVFGIVGGLVGVLVLMAFATDATA